MVPEREKKTWYDLVNLADITISLRVFHFLIEIVTQQIHFESWDCCLSVECLKTFSLHHPWYKKRSYMLLVFWISANPVTSFCTSLKIWNSSWPGACIIKLITAVIYGFHDKREREKNVIWLGQISWHHDIVKSFFTS